MTTFHRIIKDCGAMILQLFANVQKLLQVGVFFLLYRRVCSLLFVWVGVRTDQALRRSAFRDPTLVDIG